MRDTPSRVWATSADGLFVFKTMTEDYVDGALNVMRYGFVPNECVCTGIMLADSSRAIEDLMHMCRLVAADRASIVAMEAATGRVAGVAFNKIQPMGEKGDETFIDVLRSRCSDDPAFNKLLDVFIEVDNKVNVYERYGVKTLLEMMYVAVLPEFRGRGLALSLVQCTEDMATALATEQVQVDNPHGKDVGLIFAFFTSSISQRLGVSLGWDSVVSVGHDQLEYRGKKFSERIGPQHPDNLVMAKRIGVAGARPEKYKQ